MAIDPFFGSVLAAGTNLIGGLLGGSAQSVAQGRAADQAANQAALQKEFAQGGITWRARDVIRAYGETGIHPLALLGVQGPTYSPVTTAFSESSPIGEGIAKAGQDISRGINASADRDLRETGLNVQKAAAAQAAERGGLENELLRIRIHQERMRLAQLSAPGVPSPKTNVVGPSYEYVKTPSGYMMLKSGAAQNRLEDDAVGTALWNVGHRTMLPPPPEGVRLAPGMQWQWNPASQEYRMIPIRYESVRHLMPFNVKGRRYTGVPIPPGIGGMER